MDKTVKKATRQGFGDGLLKLAEEAQDLVVIDADLAHAVGTLGFAKKYPERHFETGIAEQNMIGVATGLSKVGYVPFACSFAMFTAGRAFEIIRNAVAYSNANVKILGSHSGITPAGDGGTHQCIEDIAAMRSIPNMTILSPCDYNQAQLLVKMAYDIKGPVYLRVSREPMPIVTSLDDKLEFGKAQVMQEGSDVCIVATGVMTMLALEAAEELAEEGIKATVLNLHTIKPLDIEGIISHTEKCGGRIVVCEEANRCGGIGEAIAYGLLGRVSAKMAHVCVEDRFGQSGWTDELLGEYGITSANIKDKVRSIL